jgi:FKBP-type peptidyl-prolyl cis-trans isomerase FkpA
MSVFLMSPILIKILVMKKIGLLLLVLKLVSPVVVGQDNSFEKTASGLMYKIMTTTRDSVVKEGDILKIQYTQLINDSVLGSSYSKTPAYAKIKSVPDNAYSPEEIFKLLRKGDSVLVVQLVDTLINKFPPGQIPPFMKKGDRLVLQIKIEDVFATDSLAMADSQKYMEAEQAIQMADMKKRQEQAEKEMKIDLPAQSKKMKAWLLKKKIVAAKTGLGTYVKIKYAGTGAKIKTGDYITVKYTGKHLENGKVFQSNMKGENPPYGFVIGRNNVIKGWDEGLLLLRKGAKATLYIPAALAYGRNPQAGSPFKPNEPLIFDVEIASVGDAPEAAVEQQ